MAVCGPSSAARQRFGRRTVERAAADLGGRRAVAPADARDRLDTHARWDRCRPASSRRVRPLRPSGRRGRRTHAPSPVAAAARPPSRCRNGGRSSPPREPRPATGGRAPRSPPRGAHECSRPGPARHAAPRSAYRGAAAWDAGSRARRRPSPRRPGGPSGWRDRAARGSRAVPRRVRDPRNVRPCRSCSLHSRCAHGVFEARGRVVDHTDGTVKPDGRS